jgi:arylsulfatase A-like enzyme
VVLAWPFSRHDALPVHAAWVAAVLMHKLREGATAGAMAGAAYGTVETIFAVLWRWLMFRRSYAPPSAAFTLLLLVVYPLAGAALGATIMAGAALLDRARTFTAVSSGFQSVCIGIFCAANSLVLPERSRLFVVVVVLVIAAAAAAHVRFVANPWVASVLLVAPLWIVKEVLDQNAAAWNAAGAVTFASLAVAYALARTIVWIPPPWTSLATLSTVTILSLVIDGPPIRERALRTAPPNTPSPNIVLVVFDTVRADHLSLYGYDRSTAPRLEAFARHATVYERAYAPSNATLPTHAAWFTGLWPSEHGARFDEQARAWRPLSPNAVTLAESLAGRGYVTGSVVANYTFLGEGFGLDRGFHYLDARPPRMLFGDPRQHYLRARIAALIDKICRFPATIHRLTRSAEEINASAIVLLDRLRSQRPFFLFVNYMDAHSLCIPPEPYASTFEGRDRLQPLDLFHLTMRDVLARTATRVTITPAQERHFVSQYDGAIAYEDAAFGALMEALRSRALFDGTMVVVASDHGEVFGARGIIGHGSSTYDDQIRVPLVVKEPDQTHGTVIHQPVSTMLIHELIDAVRIGRPLGSLPVVSEAFAMQGPAIAQSLAHSGSAIIDGKYKLIENLRGDVELYDLVADPHETSNLADIVAMQPITARLRQAFGYWRNQRRPYKLAAPTQHLEREAADRIRALGYVH